jgi:hypothetical protein
MPSSVSASYASVSRVTITTVSHAARMECASPEIRIDQAAAVWSSQVVVRFVEQNLVRKSRSTTERNEERQQGIEVLDLPSMGNLRQVDDDAHVRVTKSLHELPRAWRRIVTAQSDDSR